MLQVGKACQPGTAFQRIPDKRASEQSPLKSGSPIQGNYVKQENALNEDKDLLQSEQPENSRQEPMAFQGLPQSSDDAGLSLPGIDVSETSYPEHSPDNVLHSVTEDEEMKDQGMETQSMSSDSNGEDNDECDIKIGQTSGDIDVASPSSFEELQETEVGSAPTDALETADDELLAEDVTILEREDDVAVAGISGSELSEESEEIDPGQASMGSISGDDEGAISEDEEHEGEEFSEDIPSEKETQHNPESICIQSKGLQDIQSHNHDLHQLEMSELQPPCSNDSPALLDLETSPDLYDPSVMKLDQEVDNSSPRSPI